MNDANKTDISKAESNGGSNANHNASEGGSTRLSLKSIFETLNSVKEWMLVAAFFGGAIVWTVHYYATHEELDILECQMKLNIRMLEATSDRQFNEQLAQKARGEIRDEERTIKKAETLQDDDGIRLSQARLDSLKAQLEGFEHAIEKQGETSKKAWGSLTQNSCFMKDVRNEILKEIRAGKY